jgi:hypothetical protein
MRAPVAAARPIALTGWRRTAAAAVADVAVIAAVLVIDRTSALASTRESRRTEWVTRTIVVLCVRLPQCVDDQADEQADRGAEHETDR